MANGTRNDSITNQSIDLFYCFFKNGTAFNAADVLRVEIYDNITDAQAGTNIIETIDNDTGVSVDDTVANTDPHTIKTNIKIIIFFIIRPL